MSVVVELTGDAGAALAQAETFLARDPVLNNVILTLLHGRRFAPAEGRYAIASRDGAVAGVVFQSPLTFMATISPMDEEVVEACVDALVDADASLPGVGGEARTAAHFTGHWTERTKSAAVPRQGQRIYEVTAVESPRGVSGQFRPADDGDSPTLVEWLRAFGNDTGEPVADPAGVVKWRVAAGQFCVWQDGELLSMAAVTPAVAGVARVQAVYTPPELRGRGYASACVAALSASVLDAGTRCILYTDLGNPVSNSVYRRLGYRAVAELLRYDFDCGKLDT